MATVPRRSEGDKPAKPYAEFPLFPHATKRWAKKIRGKLHYFGPWDDPHGALERYVDQRDDLHAGRRPRSADTDGVTIRELMNRFLTSKQHLVDAKELTRRSFDDYHDTCRRVAAAFGLSRLVADLDFDDFEMLKSRFTTDWGPVTVGNHVQRVRTLFKYAYDTGLVAQPIRFGPDFKRPSKRVLRKHRAENGPRMFEAPELRTLLAAARQPLRAMLMLGINCGFGNHDVGSLPRSALDLDARWVAFPRPSAATVAAGESDHFGLTTTTMSQPDQVKTKSSMSTTNGSHWSPTRIAALQSDLLPWPKGVIAEPKDYRPVAMVDHHH